MHVFSPCKGVGARISLGNKYLAFSPAWVWAVQGGRALPFGHIADRRQEWSGLNAGPQGAALPGHGQDRATQPLCTSIFASPHPSTTRKGEAAVVLFQSRTKMSFILSGDATFRFAMSVSELRLAVCVTLVRARLHREKQKWETVL